MKQCVQQAHFTMVQPVFILAVISCDKTLEIVLFIRSYKVYLIKKSSNKSSKHDSSQLSGQIQWCS